LRTALEVHFTEEASMDQPLVSTVIPVYNGDMYLAQAIDSVLAQDYAPVETIVVDDGSEDATGTIARSYDRVLYIRQENQGHGAARNTGIVASSGEFVAFLDADDVWLPNKLSTQIGYMLQHSELGYTIPRLRRFLEPGTDRPPWLKDDDFFDDRPAYIPSGLVVRRIALDLVGLFDPSYRHGTDSDWFFRAQDAGVAMHVLPQTLLLRRIHSDNLSRARHEVAEDMLRWVRSSVRRKRGLANG
jgi:glycosyltransferase involved in cell wall biosynthesis